MFAHTLVVAGLLLSASPEPSGPKLEKGLEARWAGTFQEAVVRPGGNSARTFDVDVRMFVVDVGDFGSDVAILSRVSLRPDRGSKEVPPSVVRLEFARANPQGHLQSLPSPVDHDNPAPKARPFPSVDLAGLPVPEGGMFVMLPDKPLKVGLTWITDEAGRPNVTWKVTDQESFRGQPAWKVVAEQRTENYLADRVRKAEWHRKDTITLSAKARIGARFERVIDHRDPDHQELSQRSVLNLELQGRMVFPARLADERKEEIVHAAAFTAQLDRLVASGDRVGPKPYETLIADIDRFVGEHPASDTVPYREAVLGVRKRAAAAAKGNLAPVVQAAARTSSPAVSSYKLATGTTLPDMTAPTLTASGSVTLSKLRGKPTVVAYFQPKATTADKVLQLADELHQRGTVQVVPLSVGPTGVARKRHGALKLTVPIHDGNDVYEAHGLESTPVLIVLDGRGVVRHVVQGWTSGTPAEVTRAVAEAAK